jgi:hypothetical protein
MMIWFMVLHPACSYSEDRLKEVDSLFFNS